MIEYVGTGSAVHAYNPLTPYNDSGLSALAGLAGRFEGFTIDGTKCGVGAIGIHDGDMEGRHFHDLVVQNFTNGQMQPTTGTLGCSGSGSLAASYTGWYVTGVNAGGETMENVYVGKTPSANSSQIIKWSAITGATSYNVYRATGNTPGLIANVPAGTLTYTDTGAAPITAGAAPPIVNYNGSKGVLFENINAWYENALGHITVRNSATSSRSSLAALAPTPTAIAAATTALSTTG